MANPNPRLNLGNLRPPWKPGESGNPGGHSRSRRITAALISLIEEKGADRALATVWLREALAGNPHFFRELLNRVEGKVPDAIESVESGNPTADAIRSIVDQAEAETPGESEGGG